MSALTEQDEREQFSAMIARMNAETRKFIADHDKPATEREKLASESRKLERDRLYAPVLAAAAVADAVAATVSTLIRFL